jgi:hypothetical protein
MIGDAIVPRDRDGDVSVKPQDRTTEPLDLFFIKQLGNATTLSTPAAQGDYEITVVDVTGFVAGTYLGMFTPEGKFHFATQIGAPVGNVLTLDTAVCCPFASGVSSVLNFTRDMNVDGSDTRQIFQIGPVGPGAGLTGDITKILISLTDNLAMDDSKFGGNGALARGVVLRKNNHEFINYSNWKCNACTDLLFRPGKSRRNDPIDSGRYLRACNPGRSNRARVVSRGCAGTRGGAQNNGRSSFN